MTIVSVEWNQSRDTTSHFEDGQSGDFIEKRASNRIGFEWNQQQDKVNWFDVTLHKMLILSNGIYYTYNEETEELVSLGSAHQIELDKAFFDENGFEELGYLTSDDWEFLKSQSKNIKLLHHVPEGSNPRGSVQINYKDIDIELEVGIVPLGQLTTSIQEIPSIGELYDVIIEQISDNAILKTIVSNDNGDTWKTYLNNQWQTIDRNDTEHLRLYGMNQEKFNNIPPEDWLSLNVDMDSPLMIDYYLEVYSNENYGEFTSVDFEEIISTDTPKIEDLKFYILNTVATIDVSFIGGRVDGSIDDADKDKVQYRIFLNGEQYYPEEGFTEFRPSPLEFSIAIDRDKIIMDELNILRVEFRDQLGSTDYWEQSFIGTYYGLMFKDEQGEYYSTESGEILKKLDFGDLVAGQTSIDHRVILENTYGVDLKDVLLFLDKSELEAATVPQLSLSNSPFIGEEELMFERLNNGESVEFFVRIVTNKNATRGGDFDIKVKAIEA